MGPSSNTTARWCADRHLRAKWLQESSDIHLSGLPNFYLWSIQADSRQEKPQRQESRACFGLRKWPMNLLQVSRDYGMAFTQGLAKAGASVIPDLQIHSNQPGTHLVWGSSLVGNRARVLVQSISKTNRYNHS